MADGKPAARFPRWVRLTAGGCAVAVVAATAYLVLGAGTSNAATSGLRTAAVRTGSVTQTIGLSGSVQRVDQVSASFRTAGTVTSVKVGVGAVVKAGQVLATMQTAPLKSAVAVAQANLVAAQAALDAASAASTSSSASTSSAASPSPTRTSSASGSSHTSGSGGSSGTSGSISTKPLSAATTTAQSLLQAATLACAPVLDPANPPSTPSSSPTPTPTSSSTPTPTSTASANPTPTPVSTAAVDPTPTDTSPNPTDTPTPSSTQTATPTAPTAEQLTACIQALSAVMTGQGDTAKIITSLAAMIDKAATALQNQTSSSAVSSSAGAGSGSFASASAGASGGAGGGGSTASLAVSVLKATQALATAQQDLDGATLKAPINGTVGSVGMTAGQQASTSSAIVIVGPGTAIVTVDLPLAHLGQVRVAQDVVVTPAGTTQQLPGLVESIGVLPTSTSTSSPTYPVQVSVSSAPVTLASGSIATATITLATAKDVLTVPVSAVTGVNAGAGAVQVLSGGTLTTTEVTIGAIGQGLAQISEGLKQGQLVVLADPSQPLPTANAFQRPGAVGGLSGGGFNRPGGGG